MKNKEEKKNRVWVPIVIGAVACSVAVGTGVALVHNQQRPKASAVATVSDAMESAQGKTEVVEVTTEETTTEAALEVIANEGSKPEAVPTTTEIGGGKKKAEETTEEQKPNTSSNNGSGHSSNGGSASSGQSTTPKPSNSGSGNSSGNSGNSSSNNSGSNNSGNNNSSGNNSGNSSSNNGGSTAPATTEAPTTQHQHVYDQVVVDTPAWTETIVHPAEYKTVPAMQCHGCKDIFTSADAYFSHPCGDAYGFTETNAKEKVKEETTEYVEHSKVTHRECKCGARE